MLQRPKEGTGHFLVNSANYQSDYFEIDHLRIGLQGLRLGLVVELFQGRVAMDTCMDVNEFHHVCEVDHEGTASGFGGAELLPDISATELLTREESATQRVVACLAEEAEAEWQSHFRIFQSNQKSWVPYHRNSPVWAFFQLLDGSGGGRVDASIVQTMRCVICHPTSVSSPSSIRTRRSRKGVVNYNHNHGSTSLKKHVDAAHSELYDRYVKEMAEKQALETPTSTRTKNKKRKSIQASQIVDFFGSKEAYRKLDLPQVNYDFVVSYACG